MRRIAALTVAALALALPAGAPAATLDLFSLPAGHTIANFGVTVDGTGAVWLGTAGPVHGTNQPTPSLARVDPGAAAPNTAQGVTTYPTPDPAAPLSCCANQLRSVTFNAVDGYLYYVRNDGGLGRALPAALTPGSSAGISATRTSATVDLWDVAPGRTGGAFFTEKTTGNAPDYVGARVAFWNGTGITEGPNVAKQNGVFVSSRYDAKPSGIAVAPSGTPWFVEEDAGNPGYRLARWTLGADAYAEWSVAPCESASPCSGSFSGTGLTGVTVAPDGGVWFTNNLNRKFGRFDPATQQMVQYTLASVDPTLAPGRPREIVTAPDGTLWMTVEHSQVTGSANALVQIVPSATPTATVYKTGPTVSPLGLAVDAHGAVWFGASSTTAGVAFGRLSGATTPDPDPDPGPGTPDPGTGGGGTPATTAPGPAPVRPAAPNPAPVPLVPATTAKAQLTPPRTRGDEVDTNQVCVGPPQARCSVIYMLREREYVAGFPSAKGKRRSRRKAPRVLGTKTVTLAGGQRAKVTVRLNALGKRILKGKRKLSVVFTASEKLANGRTRTVSRRTLTMRPR